MFNRLQTLKQSQLLRVNDENCSKNSKDALRKDEIQGISVHSMVFCTVLKHHDRFMGS